MPSNFLDPEILSLRLSEPDYVRSNAFEIVQHLCSLTGQESTRALLQENVLRLLGNRDQLADYSIILDGLARELGLFPFLSMENLGLADSLAYEFHRPDSMQKDIVFHGPQARIYRLLMSGKNVVLSAPTSFGKSLIIDAVILSGKHSNIALVVPTIALISETRRRMASYDTDYKIVTHPSQEVGKKNIFILTQERILEFKRLEQIDFFVIDEFYKLGSEIQKDGRVALLNQAFYRLLKTGAQFYMLGPLIKGLTDKLRLHVDYEFVDETYQTVVSQTHFLDSNVDEYENLISLCKNIEGPTLIYCSSPARVATVAETLIRERINSPVDEEIISAVSWISKNFHSEWHVTKALANGIGIHHARIPRALSQYMVRAFDAGKIKFLICTSTLIEGVNTQAQNVIVFDNTISNKKYDYFTFNNIRGRSGRMFKHFVGHVYLFHPEPLKEFPKIDIPALTQPDSTPESLLIQLDYADLNSRSKIRIEPFLKQQLLSLNTLKNNLGIDLEGQLSVAKAIYSDLPFSHKMLCWKGIPTWKQTEYITQIIWHHFNGALLSNRCVFTANQLAYFIHQLRTAPSARDLIESRLGETTEPDTAVTQVLDFLRKWAMFHYPRLLRAIDNIQRDIFEKENLLPGDFSLFATKVENLFVDSSLIALEEFGLPMEISRHLGARLSTNGDLDAALTLLKSLSVGRLQLSIFESAVIRDVQNSLGKNV